METNLDWVRALAFKRRQVISPRTMAFCERWVGIIRAAGDSIMKDKAARALIRDREVRLKWGRSRFTNPRALDQWNGSAGLIRMNYRWSTVTRFIRDLQEGLNGD